MDFGPVSKEIHNHLKKELIDIKSKIWIFFRQVAELQIDKTAAPTLLGFVVVFAN